MSKRLVPLLMIPLLLLAGCGEREVTLENNFAAFRQGLTQAEVVSATVELTAYVGDTVETYTMAVTYDGQQTTMELVSPEILAGIKATAQDGQTAIAYENVMLSAGALNQEGLTPVSAMPAILKAMASGYTELLWWEADQVAARLYVGENSVCTLWLEPDTLTPVTAEIASAGQTVLTCQFTMWEIS
jgi:hypothetical protein